MFKKFRERSALIDVSEDIEYENFKALCAAEFGFESTNGFQIISNGNILPDIGSKAIRSLGVSDNDLVLLQTTSRIPSQNNSEGNGTSQMDMLRQLFGNNPQRMEQLKRQAPGLVTAIERGDSAEVMRQIGALSQGFGGQIPNNDTPYDPMDPSVQEKMMEQIRRENVDANLEHALEHSPESFGHVVMLYINVKVNGQPVKAFVDSGAQMTIMSKSCAERCNLMKLLDTRFAGIAKGVGVQKILGRIHLGLLQIGDDFLQCTFSVLEDQEMDFLLGLDMLRRHQCSIDLKNNVLTIGTTGKGTPFLPESELPHYAKLSYEASESDRQKLADKLKAQDSLKNGETPGTSGSSNAISTSRPSSAKYSEEVISEITRRNFTRDEAISALTQYNGDAKKALANLLVSKLSARSLSAKGPRK